MPSDTSIRVPMVRRVISRTYEQGGGGLAANEWRPPLGEATQRPFDDHAPPGEVTQ